MSEIEKKRCKRCGRELELTEFGFSKVTTDGYMSICQECRAERAKNLKERHKARRAVRFWECDIIARPEHRESK